MNKPIERAALTIESPMGFWARLEDHNLRIGFIGDRTDVVVELSDQGQLQELIVSLNEVLLLRAAKQRKDQHEQE